MAKNRGYYEVLLSKYVPYSIVYKLFKKINHIERFEYSFIEKKQIMLDTIHTYRWQTNINKQTDDRIKVL